MGFCQHTAQSLWWSFYWAKVMLALREQRRFPKGRWSFHVEGSSPSTWSEATTLVPSASQEYVPLSPVDTLLMYKRATFQSCSTTTLRPSGCNGCPSFFHWALTGREYWQMNSAGWFSTTQRSSISLTTSTVGSEVGVRGHRVKPWPWDITIYTMQDVPDDRWAL